MSSVSFKTANSRAEWEQNRAGLLVKEKEYTKMRDELTKQRNNLPMYKLTDQEIKSFQFHSIAKPDQTLTLYDLFGSNQNRLLIYNCMSFKNFPCGACTVVIKQLDSVHEFLQKYASTCVISRAPIDKLSSAFNEMKFTVPAYNCNLSFTNFVKNDCNTDENNYSKVIPGMSSFYLDRTTNSIYLFYTSFDRGVEDLENYFNWFDRIPLNKREDRGHPFKEWPIDESGRSDPNLDEKHKSVNIAGK